MLTLDPSRTALIIIDLQKGILAQTLAPHSAETVLAAARALGQAAKDSGARLVLVNVDGVELRQPVDAPTGGTRPEDWAVLDPAIAALKADIAITKRQWGAFFGTELDLRLRRRGIDTIILCGIATNFGVEQTAREAWQMNYSLVIAEDATTALSAEMHDFSITRILPRIARVRAGAEIIAALKAG